ncbi:sensor histidine kinase [Granulicella sp. S190]|uniref:sensor histidine kinase n=1 Tax=Granulicella sp. S190 TaxID=1747226 RepID=UPI00131A7550|nr:sensor histidine kinase [Granulicella sp. S190]
MPEDTVQALAETGDGYLWIGTTGGLTRFDGMRFVLNGSNTLPSPGVNSIFCLSPSRDGSLWIGTEGGGLLRLLNGSVKHYGEEEGLTDGFVRSVFEDHRGTLWIGTDSGLFRVEGDRVKRIGRADAKGPLAVHEISEDSIGKIWVGGSRLLSIEGEEIHFYDLPGSYSSNRVKAVLQTTDGTVWVGTVSGLERLSRGKFEAVPALRGTVRALMQTSDGTLWIGTIGDGVWTYRDGVFSHLRGLLPGNTVLRIFEDSSHQIWFGLVGGLVRLSRTPVRVVPLPGGSDSDYETISGDGDGSLWVVASGVYRVVDGIALPYRFRKLPEVRIRNIFRGRDGDLWIGTDGTGAYRLTPHGIVHYSAPSELTNNFIRAFLEGRNGDMWIATDEGVSLLTRQSVRKLTMADGLVHFSTRSLLEDDKGDIWIGTDQGLSRWHQNGFAHDAATEALQNEKVWAIYEDPTHTIWFGTRDHGLFRYQNGRIAQFTTVQGLASNSIYQILEDPQRRLWLSGPNSISSLSEPQLNGSSEGGGHLSVSVYPMPYGAEDAQMYGGRQPSGYLDPNGSVWFPSSKGAVQVLLNDKFVPGLPRLLLENVTLDGRTLPLTGLVQLPSRMTRLEFSYAPLSLRPQTGIRYQYKLEGFDRNWVYAGTNLSASYTNLPAGTYRFRVQAFEVNNPTLLTEASIEVRRSPFFWQRWWFLLLCTTALLLLTWAVYRLRMHQVRLRFRAVFEERERLAREMHDTVIQGCTSVSALLEAVASLQPQTKDPKDDLLHHAREQVRTTIDEARHAVWNLRHEDGAAVDLNASIAAISAQTLRDFGVTVSHPVNGEAYSVPGAVSRELLMVVREAIYNAILHGHPTQITVAIRYETKQLCLLVIDDGVGFKPGGVPVDHHYGITGMQERMEQLGGTFAMESEPGSGTQVKLTIERSILSSKAEHGRRWAIS